jgi:hypothetical protein
MNKDAKLIYEAYQPAYVIMINPHQESYKRRWLTWDGPGTGREGLGGSKKLDEAYVFDCKIKAAEMFNKWDLDSGQLLTYPDLNNVQSLP